METKKVLISVDKARLGVAPGASGELAVTVENLTPGLDLVEVTLLGVNPDWVDVIPPKLDVFGKGKATARVIIHPPRDLAQSRAGTYLIRVSARSQAWPGQEGEAATELQVPLVGDYLISGPSEARDRREASYSIHIQNRTNAPLQIRPSARDEGAMLWYRLEPPRPEVEAGAETEVLLAIRAKRAVTEERTIAFDLAFQADSLLEGGDLVPAPPRQATYRFVQLSRPTLGITLTSATAHIKDTGPARYELQLHNPNNEPVRVCLEGTAEGSDLDFQPPELLLAPQGTTPAVLDITPGSWPAPGEQWTIPFSVTAVPIATDATDADDAPLPVTVQGTLIQSRTRPGSSKDTCSIRAFVLATVGLAIVCWVLSLFALLLMALNWLR